MEIDKLINKLCERFSIDEKSSKVKAKLSVFSDDNVMAVVAKTKMAQKVLMFFKESTIPADNNIKYETKTLGTCLYSLSYIKWAVEFLECDEGFKNSEGAVKLSLREEYPLTLESKNFKVIIAPRVHIEEDENEK